MGTKCKIKGRLGEGEKGTNIIGHTIWNDKDVASIIDPLTMIYEGIANIDSTSCGHLILFLII